MSPIYKWFYVAEFFAGVGTLAHLLQASVYLSQPLNPQTIRGSIFGPETLEFTLVFHHIPLAIAVTIGLIVTWRYWGWLVTDRKR